MNLSESAYEALDTATSERWQEEHREGIAAMNVFVERNDLFTDDENFQVL